jgi:cytidylate kinase
MIIAIDGLAASGKAPRSASALLLTTGFATLDTG